ncbi:MAG: HEAT repeat domain-containing protein [Gemmataceae bacterium]
MNRFREGFVLLMLLTIGSVSWGQPAVPGAPAVPGVPATPGAPAAAGAAAGGGGGNIWSFLSRTPAQREAKRARFCNSLCGQVFGSVLTPVNAFTGGLIEGPCAAPLLEDLAQPGDSAVGAAARIKQDELAAKERRAAVRYLSTVDCRRWPEAEEALILALRGDRNECVRFEAALALGRGCCCTPKTVEAMSITAAGSTRDGFPEERSKRVREAARISLNHCLSCLADQGPPLAPVLHSPQPTVPGNLPPERLPFPQDQEQGPEPKEGGKEEGKKTVAQAPKKPKTLAPAVRRAAYYQQVEKKPLRRVAGQAQQMLRQEQMRGQLHLSNHHKPQGMIDIIHRAWNPPTRDHGPNFIPNRVAQPQPTYFQQSTPVASPYSHSRASSGGLINRVMARHHNNATHHHTSYQTVEEVHYPVQRMSYPANNANRRPHSAVSAWMDR